MERKHLLIAILSLVMVFLSFGRLKAAKNIEFFVLVPPEQMLETVRKIAVLDFTGTNRYWRVSDGRKASDYIVASLMRKSRGIHDIQKESTLDKLSPFSGKLSRKRGTLKALGKLFGKKAKKFTHGKNIKGRTFQEGVTTDFYEVVERSRIQDVLKEQNFSNSSLVDPAQTAQLGKVLGVDAVISGTGEVAAYDRWKATATLSVRIVDVTSGKILGQRVVTKITHLSSEAASTEAVREKAIEEAANEAVIYFTPYFSLQKIDFQELKLKEYKSDSKRAIKSINRGELGKALAIYTSIINRDPYNHKALYMQGVVYELASNYDKALERYNMAYQVFDESDQYHEAVVRTEGQQNLWKVLNRNGVRLTVKNMLLTKNELESAGKQKVKLKGSSKIRIPVYASPGNSEVMMNIPGGLSMEFIKIEGGYFKVKLITGQEGYINSQDVKNSEALKSSKGAI